MSTLALSLRKLEPATPSIPSLGPAEVLDTRPSRLRVRLGDGREVEAGLALAFPYEPCVGDRVLVIGNDDGHYLIGVLQGTGKTVLTFPADTELRALDGVLKLAAGKGVEIEAPRFSLVTRKMQVVAEDVMEKLGTLHQTVSQLFALRVGQMQTLADGSIHQQSKRATILSEEKVHINGREVHLG